MKKIIKLTENDLIRIVKRVIKEQENPNNKVEEVKKILEQSVGGLSIENESGFTVFKLKNVEISINKNNLSYYIKNSDIKTSRIEKLLNDKLNYTRQGMFNHDDVSAKELADIIKEALLMPEGKQM
jgi:hypothetical protein